MAHKPFEAWTSCVLVRLHRRFEADPPCTGLFVFGNPDAQVDASSNRSFLVELCESNNLAVANTVFFFFFFFFFFLERLAEEQATYYNCAPTRTVRF